MVSARELLTRRVASNLAAVRMDLAGAVAEDDVERVALLETLAGCGADILLYRPQLQHFALLFGDIETAPHVAVMVPGIGDGTTLREDWIPRTMSFYEASTSTAVILWKGYDNPAAVSTEDSAETTHTDRCSDELVTAASELTAFVDWLELDSEQSLTVVARGYGLVITGVALADCALDISDLLAPENPELTADELRRRHIRQAHLVSEPGSPDVVGERVVPGALRPSPIPPSPPRPPIPPSPRGHRVDAEVPHQPTAAPRGGDDEPRAETFEGTSGAAADLGGEARRDRARYPEIVGGLAAWALRAPAVPLRSLEGRLSGPGHGLVVLWRHAVEIRASTTGHLVFHALDTGERALGWMARRVGAIADDGGPTGSPGPGPGQARG